MDITKLQKGADAVLERLINAMRGGREEVHPQSLVCAVGSLAGYACQKDVRVMFMKKNGLSEDKVFTIMTDKQGRKFYFGDLINEPLVNEKYSVWSMIGGAVKQRGGSLPDVNDIFRYISYTVGGENFGRPRACQVGEPMSFYLKQLWLPLAEIASKFAEDGELHILYGIALQKAVFAAGGSMNVTEAARIAMESAVSMSKVDFNALP
ncbi:hypothetical protein [Ruminococcus sp.]|uniref:hypothetical protein n=1 Tax=Ruminococcus sp. TaxID=41978 RepID=UPI0025CC8FBA|nr:hypothetical protein [Ruminococcus sp.]MBQ8964985.1 hypothetical protein [Ruminococcus sp.]